MRFTLSVDSHLHCYQGTASLESTFERLFP